jgi:hypothetical protein
MLNPKTLETALRMVLAEKFYLPAPQRKLPLYHEDVTAAMDKFIARAKTETKV